MAKNVVEELLDARAEIDGLTKLRAADLARAEQAEAQAKAAQAETAKAQETAAQAAADLTAEQAAHTQTKGELDKAKQALANPAFAAAAAGGDKVPVPEGGVAATEKPMTRAEAQAAYNAIPAEDAKARAAFRKENKEALGL